MAVVAASIQDLAQWYIGGLAHVHTRLSNHPGHYESNQTVHSLVQVLVREGLAGHPGAPLGYIMINEHASDSARPQALRRYGLRARALMRQQWHRTVLGVPIWYGFEASLLSGGLTDLTPRLAEQCTLVIGSRHWVLPEVEGDPAAITQLLQQACHNPGVHVLGHPARHIEGLRGVDWAGIFATAAATGTAIEVNLNIFPDPDHEPARERFWMQWLRLLHASGALIFIGSDLHNDVQLARFLRDWRGLGRSRPNTLAACLMALAQTGIAPERVVTSRYDRFQAWLALDKAARAALAHTAPA